MADLPARPPARRSCASPSSMSRQTCSGIKRGPSFGSNASSGSMSLQSALRPPKKWKTNETSAASTRSVASKEVSFGSIQETVVFDRTDSTKPFLRVAVSDLSFGSSGEFMGGVQHSGSFRWGEQRNATWSTVHPPVAPPAPNARWTAAALTSTTSRMMQPQNNILLRQSGLCRPPPDHPGPSSSSSLPLGNASHHSVRLPQRCASPPGLASLGGAPQQHQDSAVLHHVSLTSWSGNSTSGYPERPAELLAPPRQPERSTSPMSILPEPMAPAQACPIFTPPKRPVRCRSPHPFASEEEEYA